MVKKKTTTKPVVTSSIDEQANKITAWVGSTGSLILHTLLFIASFGLTLFGVSFDTVLLILTTAVSLEAIYLAIFIQRSVNRQSETLEGEFDHLEEAIAEDIDESKRALMKDLDETERNISEDIDETEVALKKDLDETEQHISEDIEENPNPELSTQLRQIIREEIERALAKK